MLTLHLYTSIQDVYLGMVRIVLGASAMHVWAHLRWIQMAGIFFHHID